MSFIGTSFNEPYSLISLLPHAEGSQLTDRKQKSDELYLLKKIIDLSLEALTCFYNEDLKQFDAQVGENMCQIRAYKTLKLAHDWLQSHDKKCMIRNQILAWRQLQRVINQVLFNWEKELSYATHHTKYNKELDGKESIKNFLSRHQLYILLDMDILYLVMCFFLTRFNHCCENDFPVSMNIRAIKETFNISQYKTKRLIRKYQGFVCKFGIFFITNIAQELPLEMSHHAILPYVCRNAEDDRQVISCLVATDILVSHCMMMSYPIIFIINRKNTHGFIIDTIYLVLMPKSINEFDVISASKATASNPYGMFVLGEVVDEKKTPNSIHQYMKSLLLENPKKLLLANAASHPQYTGLSLIEFKNNPFQDIPNHPHLEKHTQFYKEMYLLASKIGCSLQNKSTLFLKHIYAGHINREIKKIQKKNHILAYDAHTILNLPNK